MEPQSTIVTCDSMTSTQQNNRSSHPITFLKLKGPVVNMCPTSDMLKWSTTFPKLWRWILSPNIILDCFRWWNFRIECSDWNKQTQFSVRYVQIEKPSKPSSCPKQLQDNAKGTSTATGTPCDSNIRMVMQGRGQESRPSWRNTCSGGSGIT